MKSLLQCASAMLAFAFLYAGIAHADSYADAISAFKGAGTTGASSGASADSSDANTKGSYHNGMAVFTIAKGGLMYAATISGQKFDFTPRGGN